MKSNFFLTFNTLANNGAIPLKAKFKTMCIKSFKIHNTNKQKKYSSTQTKIQTVKK